MNDRLSHATKLMQPYVGAEGTLGVVWFGSSLRPWASPRADLDLVVIMDNEAFTRVSGRDRHVMGIDRGPPLRKSHDIMVYPLDRLLGWRGSPHDRHHRMFQGCHVLFDPTGRVTALCAELAALPPETRDERLRVHYHEAFWLWHKVSACEARRQTTNARLVAGASLHAIVKVLFIAEGLWARPKWWTTQELESVGVPRNIVRGVESAAVEMSSSAIEGLFADVDAWSSAKGLTFHRAPYVLGEWIMFTEEGAGAASRWSAEV